MCQTVLILFHRRRHANHGFFRRSGAFCCGIPGFLVLLFRAGNCRSRRRFLILRTGKRLRKFPLRGRIIGRRTANITFVGRRRNLDFLPGHCHFFGGGRRMIQMATNYLRDELGNPFRISVNVLSHHDAKNENSKQ